MRRGGLSSWLLLAILAAGLAPAAGMIPQASARDMGHIGTLSVDNPVIEREYPPIPGIYPFEGAHFFAYFRPPMCQQQVYCDYLFFDVELPEVGEEQIVRLTLTWPNPRERETNEIGNQLTLHVWGDPGPVAGGPEGPCASPRDPNCDYVHPHEKVFVDPSPGEPIHMTVVNSFGLNLGYTVRLEMSELKLPPLPEFDEGTGPRFRPSTGTQRPGDGSAGLNDLVAFDGETYAGPETRKVLVPGPDGEMIEIELPVIAAAQRLDDPDDRRVNPLITALVVILVVAALVTFFTIRRRRRLRRAEATSL